MCSLSQDTTTLSDLNHSINIVRNSFPRSVKHIVMLEKFRGSETCCMRFNRNGTVRGIARFSTPQRQQNRLNWARIHQNWTQIQWRGVLFSDESRFCVYTLDRRERVWRRPGERYAACCIHQHNRWGGEGVMVWAAISFDHKSPLVVIEGNMTALRYIAQVLRPTLLPLLAQHRDVITFQLDNARPHTARITMAFLGEHGVNVLPWPAYSPDMSPIEHLWDQLGRPLTRPQLIPQDSIRRLIRSMRRRCRACVAQHGGHTPY